MTARISIAKLTPEELQAFDDWWRRLRSPRLDSRSDAIRRLMAAAVAGAIYLPLDGDDE